jgi:ketosteroid isomerase-like protein
MSKWTLVALSALIILAIGCNTAAPAPPTARPAPPRTRTATPVPPDDQSAIRQLINAECEAVVQQDIDRLQGMWTSDGVVTDANHTPDNTSDDVTWKGWDAIRDRYVNIVFPSNPTFCEHFNTQVTINGDTATAISGIRIGVTNAPNSNKWTFKKTGDGWRITSLTYNVNPQQ